MPSEPTVEEVREPFVSGDIETCQRLLEWWTDLAKIGGKHEISAGEIKRAAQFCQFYLDAKTKPQMSPGEFAGRVASVLRERHAGLNGSPALLDQGAASATSLALKDIRRLAAEHNIEIVRTDRC